MSPPTGDPEPEICPVRTVEEVKAEAKRVIEEHRGHEVQLNMQKFRSPFDFFTVKFDANKVELPG